MPRLTMRHVTLSVLASLLFACGSSSSSSSSNEQEVPHFDTAQSALKRDEAPVVADTDKTKLTDDNTAFAIALHKQLVSVKPNENLVYSPHSISTALAMAYAGAKDKTADEMSKALHYGLTNDKLHPAFDWLDLQLSSRGQGAKGQDGKPFRLNVVNSVWADKKSTFQQPYLDTLAVSYGAGLNLLDFRGAPEASRGTINAWTSDKTEKKIPELIPQGAIDQDTRMVLVNAVYFNASWSQKFEKESTRQEPFNKLGGGTSTVDMMHQSASFAYGEGDGWKAVALPYDGNELSMVVVLPNDLASFESSLNVDQLATINQSLKSQEVVLSLPKTKLDTGASLSKTLQAMGMTTPFDADHANFTGISTEEQLYISDVIHKAICNVDEDGTEAAAATAVIVGGATSAPVDPPKEFKADKPFFFEIVDNATHAVVFAGRVADAAAK